MNPSLVLTEQEKKKRFKRYLEMKEKRKQFQKSNLQAFCRKNVKYVPDQGHPLNSNQHNMFRFQNLFVIHSSQINFDRDLEQMDQCVRKNSLINQSKMIPAATEPGENCTVYDGPTNSQVGERFSDVQKYWYGDFANPETQALPFSSEQRSCEDMNYVANENLMSEYMYNSNTNLLHNISDNFINDEYLDFNEETFSRESQVQRPEIYLHKKFGKCIGTPIR